jgi:diguanylate cyclase (GGDEF)-like protein
MKPSPTHSLLLRQLSKLGLGASAVPDLASWQTFLSKVDTTYKEEDQSRYLLERSLALSSEEMQELYQNLRDYSEQLTLEKDKLEHSNIELARLANHDTLTQLPNRAFFTEYLARSLRQGRPVTLLFIDLDGFKLINDSLGHAAGDLLLREVAQRLNASVRKSDLVARLGGDEFTIVLEGLEPEHVPALTEKILQNIGRAYQLQGDDFFISASIGIAHAPHHGEDSETLIKLADTAMYQAKHLGKNCYHVFTESIHQGVAEYANLFQGLRKGIERQEFFLHYQPRVNLATEKTISVEALLRWQHPERGFISPGVFIPIAENTGLIQQLGNWVLHEACCQARVWYQQGQQLRVAVNVSVKQLQHDHFVEQVKHALETSQLPPYLLELEITESAAMSNVEDNIAKLSQLKALGIYISIDDFGTAYSSLNYLKRLPVHSLKIDRSFIQDIDSPTTNQANNIAIVRSIVALGKNMDLQLVAEGVETADQVKFLQEIGCDEAQGFYFSRPVLAKDLGLYVHKPVVSGKAISVSS